MAKTRFPAAVALFGWALCIAQGAAGQEPIDGVCDDSLRNGCSVGTANDDAFPDNATTYLWRCDGQHGGTNSDKCHIRVADVVDGVCDDTVRNGCSAGTANDAAIPDNDSTYLWRCDGQRGGRNSDKCHIRVADVVDGVCDDTVRNGCSAGTANDAAIPDNATTYLWRCDGQRGGRNSDKCFIRVADVVDGVCDDTVRNGCSAGTANDDAFADNSTGYLWRCDGQRGGRNSDKCFIRVQDVPVDGVCDESARDGCAAGTANDAAVADTTSHYRWRCDGEHGGSNSGTCSRAKPPVTQVTCGGSWSPSPSTACLGQSLTQRRTCNAGCNDGDCATSRTVSGSVPPTDCEWGAWGQWGDWGACSVTCGGGTQSRSRTRSITLREVCGGTCTESGRDTESQSCNTHPCQVPCGTCNCTGNRRDATDAGICSNSGGSCRVAANNCPQDCGTCGCTAVLTDAADAGTCSISGDSCTVTANNCPVVEECVCTASGADATDAGTLSVSGGSCTVAANNCPQDCGACGCTAALTDAADAGTCSISGDSCTVSANNCPVEECDCTASGTDATDAGTLSVSGGSCTVAANNCPQDCGTCGCTASRTDAKDAGICSISRASCTVSADNCPQDCGTCSCTAGSTDATNAGACSISGNFCLVGANNCGVTGRCDNSARNGCLSGSPNDAAIGDTASLYRWRCDGLNGGANSGTCSKSSTLCGISRESCTQGAAPSPGQCPGTEHREHFGEPCFWYCTLGGRTETCSL